MSKRTEAIDKLEKEVLSQSIYLSGHYPSQLDKELLEALDKFEIDVNAYPNLLAWKNLVHLFSEQVRLGWPDAVKDEVAAGHILSLKEESAEEAEERRKKQMWDNYVPASEKRPLDEFYDLTQIQSLCV